MRIDRKKIFLALSDFPIDTPPPHSFSYHAYVTSYDGDGVSRHVITHIEKTFSLDIVVSRWLLTKSPPTITRAPSPFRYPYISVPAFRLPSKLYVPSGDIQLFAGAGRGGDAFFSSAAFPFARLLLCHLSLSKQLGVCVPPFDEVRTARCVELRIFRANRVFSRILFSGFVELPAFLQYNVKQSETKPPGNIREPVTRKRGRNPARLEN